MSTINDIQKLREHTGAGMMATKKALAEATITHLAPIRRKIEEYRSDHGELTRILDKGREFAQERASAKMTDVRKKVGLGR